LIASRESNTPLKNSMAPNSFIPLRRPVVLTPGG
jgi:hypothetical protein